MLNPAGTTPVLVDGGPSAGAGRRHHRRIPRRDRAAPSCGERRLLPADPAGASRCAGSPPGSTTSSSPRSAGPLVTGALLQAAHAHRAGRRAARHRRDPCGARSISAIIWPISAGWCAPATGWPATSMTLCRSRRGRASVGGRLSGRCAMERRRGGEELVRAGEVAPVVPPAAGRDLAGPGAGAEPTPTSTSERSGRIKAALIEAARARGFDVVGVTRPDADRRRRRRGSSSSSPKAPTATWTGWQRAPSGAAIRARCGRRCAPSSCSGMNYGPDHDPLAILEHRDRGAISVYAQGDDYHEVIKPRLKELARWLIAQAGGDVKVFVDTAPVMEKPLAAAAGLGWQGKHTNLVSREFGSWLFLGAIFTTLELPPDDAETDSLRHLPRLPRRLPDRRLSGALPARCAALHLLSHHRAQGPDPARAARRDGQPHLRLRRLPRGLPVEQVRAGRAARRSSPRATALRAPTLAELARLDDAAFRALFAKTAVKRTGRDRFVRNVLIAIGNSGDAVAGAAGRAAARRRLAAGARRRGVGARAARSRAARRRLRRPMPARPIPPSPRSGPPPRGGVIGSAPTKVIREGETSWRQPWPHSRAAPCLPDLPRPPRCGPSALSRHGRSATFP